MPYTPEQNGCAERENRTLVEAARSMLSAQDLPKKLWAEAVVTAAYVLNRSAKSSVENKTPFELWYGRKATVDHLRIFGTECFVHIPKVRRKKWDHKSVKGLLTGYCGDRDGFRVWIPGTNNVYQSHDVIFKDERVVESDPKFVSLSHQPNDDVVSSDVQPDQSLSSASDSESDGDEPEQDHSAGVSHGRQPEVRSLRDRSALRKPQWLNNFASVATTDVRVDDEPLTFSEAVSSNNCKNWKQAMQEEMQSLAENDVYELVDLPSGRRAVDNRWVFKVKHNSDGSVSRYKARLVAKGYSQRAGVDYNETFSPVARFETVRSVLSVAAVDKMHLMQFDIKTAFLYGELDEEIYMRQPEGFTDGTDRVCKLKRSLYGLKQSPRCWNKRFVDFLIARGFKQSSADPCVYVKTWNGRKLIVVLYVDDGLVAATDKEDIQKFIDELTAEFKATCGPVSCFLGIDVHQRPDSSIFITQESYTRRVLEKFGMSESNSVSTPFVREGDTADRGTEGRPDNSFPYREAVGSLMYLATGTRPDIAFAVSVVSQKLDCATAADWSSVKRIFRYLRGSLSHGILYQSDCGKTLEVFSDADYAQDVETRRSTSGVICMFGGGAIAWISQKQRCIALSTTEAELIASNEAGKLAIWLQRLMSDLTVIDDVPVLRCDNLATVKLVKNPEFHKRSKHIETRYFWVREKCEAGDLRIQHVAGVNQVADVFTKPLPKPRHVMLVSLMGLVSGN